MSSAAPAAPSHYIGPPFDQAHVSDAMRVGVITCRASTPLTDVVRMMSGYQIHSVVVEDVDEGRERPWGIVTAADVARALLATNYSELTAGEVASTELVTIGSNESLERAAQIMAEHEIGHLLVVQPDTGRPAGVISALGLATVVAATPV